ncbi:hypothetical protein Tco_0995893 [Tanacetum coccineum]
MLGLSSLPITRARFTAWSGVCGPLCSQHGSPLDKFRLTVVTNYHHNWHCSNLSRINGSPAARVGAASEYGVLHLEIVENEAFSGGHASPDCRERGVQWRACITRAANGNVSDEHMGPSNAVAQGLLSVSVTFKEITWEDKGATEGESMFLIRRAGDQLKKL